MRTTTQEGIDILTKGDLLIRISSLFGSEKSFETIKFLRNLRQARKLFDAFNHEQNQKQTAVFVSQELNIARITIYRKLKELKLEPKDFKKSPDFLNLVNRSTYLRRSANNLADQLLNSHTM